MMSFTSWLFHKKMYWLGDGEFNLEGTKDIPCKKCGKRFKSYMHYDYERLGGYCYDAFCEGCDNE